MYGGIGGWNFEDEFTTSDLQQIRVRYASRLDSIQCHYANGTSTVSHGGSGGREDKFYLDKDEAVVVIYIWTGDVIDAIQFQTTNGRLSERYGGPGGSAYVVRGLDGKRERALMGFKGRCGGEVDALQPIWSSTRELGPVSVAIGLSQGDSRGGDSFNMLSSIGDPLRTALRSIVVRSANRIDAIECKYQDGTSSGKKGGTGGNGHEFTLEEGERIICIRGRAARRFDQLQFFTNKSRCSEVFGGSGGKSFVWTPPTIEDDDTSGTKMSLLCFQGGYDNEIDLLAPIWAVDPSMSSEADTKDNDGPLQTTERNSSLSHSTGQVAVNWTDETSESKLTVEVQALTSTTVSISTESRSKTGRNVNIEISVKVKAVSPSVAEREVEVKAGIETSGED